jgi:hypothetical protein
MGARLASRHASVFDGGMTRDGGEPISITDSLTGVVRGLRPDSSPGSAAKPAPSAGQLAGLFGRWDEAVGHAVAAHVRPLKVDGTTLVVEVDDPAWATQLRFLEATICQRLAEVAGLHIERVDVRVARP